VKEFSFDATEKAILDRTGRRLLADGWAEHVTVPRLLEGWQDLAAEVDRYELTNRRLYQ
jgi:hypothetical protein